jgi:hypothetical protein
VTARQREFSRTRRSRSTSTTYLVELIGLSRNAPIRIIVAAADALAEVAIAVRAV